jgi:hypothetical protein
MEFQCQFTHHPQPCDPQYFIRPVIVDVVCWTDSDEKAVAGRLALDHLDVSRAEYAGEDIYELCDADSAGWEGVCAALFELVGDSVELRGELEFDEPINHVLFLYQMVFHPVLRDWQSFILDHVATLFGEDSALVMWRGKTDLTDLELSDLGFRIISGHKLLFRPNMMQNEYSALEDERNVQDLEVPKDAEEYVERTWKE